METRSIKQYLASGEVPNIKLGQTLTFAVGEDGSKDKMFLRSDQNGDVVGYVAPNQDLDWVTTIDTDTTIGDTETLLVELTVDHVITAANGSYAFSCKVKNGSSNRAENVTFVVRDQDGNALASKLVMIDKGEEAFPATFYGKFASDHAANTTFRVYANGANDSIARGSLTPTALKVVEAGAVPLNLTLNDISKINFNALPKRNPHIRGKLWLNSKGSLRVSKG